MERMFRLVVFAQGAFAALFFVLLANKGVCATNYDFKNNMTQRKESVLRSETLHRFSVVSNLQIREVPNDFFVDIVSSNNFLVTILNRMFAFVRNNGDKVDPRLKSKSDKFQANLSQKFNWIFDDEEDEEDQPVIVENV